MLKKFLLPLALCLAAVCATTVRAATPDIVFMSDFGLTDDSVAQCKAVMLSKAPNARITDLTHNVEPFNIRLAAFLLADSAKLWPAGTVFVAVVDPGVGTARHSIALETKTGQYFVGPDNGLFTLVLRRDGLKRAVELKNKAFFRPGVTTTFHGRDVFSPVGAALADDKTVFAKLGPALKDPVQLSWDAPSCDGTKFSGTVLYVEAPYGNIATDIGEDIVNSAGLVFGSTVTVSVAGKTLDMPFVRTFGDVPQNAPLAYINSRGLLSFALDMGNFAATYNVKNGDAASVFLSTDAFIDIERAASGKVFFDIRYATKNNFTHQQVYPSAHCYLKKPAAQGLMKAAQLAANAPKPFKLCVLDCYRPLSVQKRFWSIVPDERYVADPAKGSRHNRGMAVDLAACDANGKWLDLPTGFDDFSDHAHRDYAGNSPSAEANSKMLEGVMKQAGFAGLSTEWWHFDYPGWEIMPVTDTPFE
jgi:hypothetical protein